MYRPLALLFLILLVCTCVRPQSLARRDQPSNQIIEDATADQVVAARAIFFLKRLEDDVIVYRSLGDFEESGKLARVPFETFQRDLAEVSPEVQQLVSCLSEGRLKTELRNALASYQDGAFWWRKMYQPPVVHVSKFTFGDAPLSPSDSFFAANIPYIVAIHWRQASKYLQRAVRQAAGLS